MDPYVALITAAVQLASDILKVRTAELDAVAKGSPEDQAAYAKTIVTRDTFWMDAFKPMTDLVAHLTPKVG